MNELIAYLLKASAGTVVLYLCFLFFFRKDTFYLRNRIILILTLILPLIIPLIKTSWFTPPAVQPEEVPIEAVIINSAVSAGDMVADNVSSFDYNGLMTALWLSIFGLLILRVIIGVIKTVSIIRKGYLQTKEIPKLVLSDMDHPSFSFWPYAVIPRKLYEEGTAKEIIAHENAHIRQGHTFDLILSELYVSIFWFNPAAWLVRKAIKTNHEYLADYDLTSHSFNIKDYQYRLLNIREETDSLQLAHSFNSLIKNRIIMINRKPTRTYATWKNLLILPTVALIFAAFSFKAVNQKDENSVTANSETANVAPQNSDATNSQRILSDLAIEKPQESQKSSALKPKADTLKSTLTFVPGIGQVYSKVTQMPQFPGGQAEMMKFIRDSVKYPAKAKEMGIQGTVIATFIVNDKGKVVNVKIARGVGSGCDEEALRVIKSMPDWMPGNLNGKAVAVSFALPISFVLQPDKINILRPDIKNIYGSPQKITPDSLMFIIQNKDESQLPVLILDYREIKAREINKDDIAQVTLNKGEFLIRNYGERGKNGVISIISKQEVQRQTVDGEKAFVVVEQMPQFPGGEKAMMQFIKDNLKYPEEAIKNNIQATVIVNFIIDREGRIRNPRIMRSVDKSLGDEALRVLNSMPAWTPGKQGGKVVPVSYTIPVKFVLSDGNSKPDAAGFLSQFSESVNDPLCILDDKEISMEEMKKIAGQKPSVIDKVAVLKDESAIRMFGQKGKYGVIVATSKNYDGYVKSNSDDISKNDSLGPLVKSGFSVQRKDQPYYFGPPQKEEEAPYVTVEQMPQFPGGEDALKQFINSKIKYPEKAKKNGIQGVVIVNFVIGRDGKINRIKVMRPIGSGCDEEALRVIKLMPDWIPGKQGGKVVPVMYTIPVKFVIN